MRPDRLHVAVRTRGVLECLDIATLFCGRRPLLVAVAAAVGALPCILLNRLLFGGVDDDGSLLPLAWLLGMEAPWAAAPLVLALGQAVFADRVSWRHAAGALGGALPAMLVFQVLVRGACLGLVVLIPVVAVGMYFLDPIILLERPRLTRVWARRTAMNRHELGHVIGLALLDATVLVAGWGIGLAFVGACVGAWNGFAPAPPDETTGLVSVLASWPGQIAFWSANAFLVVFRFFCYLDARIRREGWDVELKFRSDGTYAGLRAVAGRAAMLAAIVAAAAACGGTTAVAANGAPSARSALERQRFPWYDATADDYRPLVDVRPPPAPERPARELPEFSPPPTLGIDRGLQVAAVLAVVAVLAWILVRYGLPDAAPGADEPDRPVAAVLGAEQLAALPEVARRHDGDLLAEAEARAAGGDYSGATIFFHAWLLVQYHARGALELARGKTNGRYVAEVAAAAPPAAPAFRRSTRLFEDAFFGRMTIAAADFQAVWDRRGGLADLEPARD